MGERAMSWGAQNRSKDAKTPSQSPAMSKKPELDLWPVQQYVGRFDQTLAAQRLFLPH
jgi:hypothetical protein